MQLFDPKRSKLLEERAGSEQLCDRARFIALRSAFVEEWQRRAGMEWLLIDNLAQASTEEMRWLKQAVSWRSVQREESHREGRSVGGPKTPRMAFAATDLRNNGDRV